MENKKESSLKPDHPDKQFELSLLGCSSKPDHPDLYLEKMSTAFQKSLNDIGDISIASIAAMEAKGQYRIESETYDSYLEKCSELYPQKELARVLRQKIGEINNLLLESEDLNLVINLSVVADDNDRTQIQVVGITYFTDL